MRIVFLAFVTSAVVFLTGINAASAKDYPYCLQGDDFAGGAGESAKGWQMSTAMMSAPSCANRTAWLRPCPRAAPVMNATLPSTRPVIDPPR